MMKRTMRVAALAVAASAVAGAARAQIPGMPLFTNPRYATGLRVHADAGQDLSSKISTANLAVVQGGVSFALGPVGLNANVGAQRNDIKEVQGCQSNPSSCDLNTKAVLSALAQLRIMGGGRQSGALSLFAGASTDLNAYDTGTLPCGTLLNQNYCDSLAVKVLTIPVGVSLGMQLGPLAVWAAPRYVMTRSVNCSAAVQARCDETGGDFRWAVGADLPLLRVLAIRAAYDSGKIDDVTVSRFGIGASIGIGGVH